MPQGHQPAGIPALDEIKVNTVKTIGWRCREG